VEFPGTVPFIDFLLLPLLIEVWFLLLLLLAVIETLLLLAEVGFDMIVFCCKRVARLDVNGRGGGSLVLLGDGRKKSRLL